MEGVILTPFLVAARRSSGVDTKRMFLKRWAGGGKTGGEAIRLERRRRGCFGGSGAGGCKTGGEAENWRSWTVKMDFYRTEKKKKKENKI
jgi:hypothetical protein